MLERWRVSAIPGMWGHHRLVTGDPLKMLWVSPPLCSPENHLGFFLGVSLARSTGERAVIEAGFPTHRPLSHPLSSLLGLKRHTRAHTRVHTHARPAPCAEGIPLQ